MAINKVNYGGQTLIDTSEDTAEAGDVLAGQTFHSKSGLQSTGTLVLPEGVPHVELTQAEYDALTPAQKENGDVYFITDGDDTAYSGIIGSGELETEANTLVGAVNELDEDIKQQKKIYRFDVTSNTSVSANNLVVWNSGYTSDNSVYLTSNGKGIKFNKAGRVVVNVHIAGSTGSAGRLWCVLQGGNYNVQGITYGAYSSVDLFAIFEVTTSFELSVKFIEAFTLCSGATGPCVFSVTYL